MQRGKNCGSQRPESLAHMQNNVLCGGGGGACCAYGNGVNMCMGVWCQHVYGVNMCMVSTRVWCQHVYDVSMCMVSTRVWVCYCDVLMSLFDEGERGNGCLVVMGGYGHTNLLSHTTPSGYGRSHDQHEGGKFSSVQPGLPVRRKYCHPPLHAEGHRPCPKHSSGGGSGVPNISSGVRPKEGFLHRDN